MAVKNNVERIWEERVAALLKVLSQHMPGGTEKSTENPQSA
jgi:hypothetical protein